MQEIEMSLTKEEEKNIAPLKTITPILNIEDENLRLWQANEEFADEINRLRTLNAKLRYALAVNNIECEL